jgi:AcrR family transcriptional regulator
MPSRPRRAPRRADPARAERRAHRREELLDAAVVVIRRDGASASMDAIAAEAGITKPIVYRHFGDRSGLVHAVAERFVGELLGELRAVLSQDGVGPRDLVAATIDAYLAFVERDTRLYRFLVESGTDQPGATARLTGFMRQVATEIAVVLGERVRVVGGDSGAAEPWAFALVGMVHLAGDWWVERQTMPRARLVEYLVALVFDGIGPLLAAPAVAEVEG